MAAAKQLRGLKEEATCSICLDYFTDPVSVECGHVFCLSCISRYWEGLQTDSPCPQCRETSLNKTLRPIRHLGNMVELLKQLHPPRASPQEENLCREHEEKLKLFCEDDQKLICVVCSMSRDHRPHTVLPILEAAQEYKKTLHIHVERLKKDLEDLQTREAQQRRTVSDLEGVQIILSRCETLKGQKHNEDVVVEKTLQSVGQYSSSQDKRLELIATIPVELDWRYMKTYSTVVTLDTDTANQWLVLTEGKRSVRDGDIKKDLPDTPERFDPVVAVLGRERLSSGRHYWEVEVGGKTDWTLGVCDESVSRKGEITCTPKNGYWTVWLRDGKYEALTNSPTLLTPCVPPRAVGLFLDYEAGRLSVYNVNGRCLLFTFSGVSFPPIVRPYFCPCVNEGGRNAGVLRILPGTGQE